MAHRSEATQDEKCTLPLFGNGLQTFASDVGRNLVIAVELTEADFIATRLQLGSDAAAATIDRKNVVVSAVRDEETRLTMFLAINHKSRRKCDDAVEEIAIDQPKRNC